MRGKGVVWEGLSRLWPVRGKSRFDHVLDMAGRYGQGKDFLVFCQHIFQ